MQAPSDAQLLATLPPHKRGLWYLRQARQAYTRRTSPRGRAGHVGGRISARIRAQRRKEEGPSHTAGASPRPAGPGLPHQDANP